MKIAIVLLGLLMFNQSCNTKYNIDKGIQSSYDSLKYPLWEQMDDTYRQLTEGYFSCCNYKISNYYYLAKAIALDYDSDGDMDSVVLIKPYHADLSAKGCFKNSEVDTNFLFICNIADKKISHVKIYRNIVSNKDPLLGEENIQANNNGIVFEGDFGHNNKFISRVYINFHKGNFFVDSIHFTTLGNKNLDSIMRFENCRLPLENYNKDWLDRLFDESM